MQLTKGIQQDVSFDKMPVGSSRFARNVVDGQTFQDISNEAGFDIEQTVNGTIIGIIPTNDGYVVFSKGNVNGEDEISFVDKDNNRTIIIRDNVLNFNTLNLIEGVYTFNFKNELIIAWWDGLRDDANVPRILNINCLPFELNPDYSFVNSSDVDLLNLFAYINSPEIELDAVLDNGGNLATGVYSFAIAYKLPDGNYSNYTSFTNWVSIFSKSSESIFIDIEGNESDSASTKSIKLTINNLLTNYTHFSLAVIKRIGGVLSSIIFTDLPITSSSEEFHYLNDDNSFNVPLESVIVPFETYTRVKTGTTLQNRLYLANLKKLPDFQYQPYANNIKLEWVRNLDVNIGQYTNSYKDPVFIFNSKGFLTNEVYAFYLVFKLKDGTYSSAYHIPGRDVGQLTAYGNLPENSRIADLITAGYSEPEWSEFIAIDPDVRYHEVYSTAKSTGELGVFENQDETYDNADCFNVADGTGIIGTIKNEKIRHHRMPSIDQLDSWGNAFYTPNTGNAFTYLLDISGSSPDWTGGVDNNLADYVVNSINATYFTATQVDDGLIVTVNADCYGYLYFELSVFLTPIAVEMEFQVIRGATGVAAYNDNILVTGSVFKKNNGKLYKGQYIQLYAGDTIVASQAITGTPVVTRPNISATIKFNFNNFNDSTTSSKVLGIKVKDLFIPDEIKEQIISVHLAYAQRTPTNSLKIGQTVADYNSFSTPNKLNFQAFDLFISKPEVEPSYVKTLYEFPQTAEPYENQTYNTPVANYNIRKIETSQYVPADVNIPLNNEESGEKFIITLINNLTIAINKVLFSELYSYKQNVYKNYVNQRLVIIPTNIGINTINSNDLYGGDTFINAVGTKTRISNNDKSYQSLIVCETNNNAALRHFDTLNLHSYIPIDDNFTKEPPIYDNYVGYNIDYTSLNNLIPILVFNCPTSCAEEKTFNFPYRIARSVITGTESETIGWRKFLTNEYKELTERQKGEIWKLVGYNNNLLSYQKYSMFMFSIRDKLATNITETYLGVTDIFDRPPLEIISNEVGYVGNQSQRAVVVCKHGVIHIDAKAGRVFLFSGQIKELSNNGLYNFFKNYGKISNDLDNPVLGNGYTATFDDRNNRLLLTKRGDDNFTLSYSFNFNCWRAFHDYSPYLMFYNREGFFAVGDAEDFLENNIYKHTQDNYGLFIDYDDDDIRKVYPAYIEAVLSENYIDTKQGVNIEWLSSVYDGVNKLYDKTFTSIVVYTQSQCSGEIQLINNKNLAQVNNHRHADFTWRFNDFRDIVLDKNNFVIYDNGIINNANLQLAKAWFKKSKFIGKHLIVRLIINNENNYKIDIADITVNVRKHER
jgi:hypothetical protein